ncbi:MAG TPA: cytochrome c3 family protein, partial [Terriglobia bacterium]|nr:cytochrome c3 family protein [Terriglobia bacterium]
MHTKVQWRLAVLLMVAAMVCSVASSQDQRPSKPLAAPKPQPIPFSHKLHTKFVKDCSDCHQIREGEMTLPSEARCMQCHATIDAESPAIKKLAAFYKERKPVPWVKVYTLPDYVYFSHSD